MNLKETIFFAGVFLAYSIFVAFVSFYALNSLPAFIANLPFISDYGVPITLFAVILLFFSDFYLLIKIVFEKVPEIEMVEHYQKEGGVFRRRLIIKGKLGEELFNQEGLLLASQEKAGIFLYPIDTLHKIFPSKRVLINELEKDEFAMPVIVINAEPSILENNDLYIETKNSKIVKGSLTAYQEVRLPVYRELLDKRKDFSLNTVLGTSSIIKDKLDKSPIDKVGGMTRGV